MAEGEATLHTRLHADVEAVIGGKRLLLWKEMMQSISYEDESVFDEFVNGTMLVGQCDPSGLWPLKFSPATMTLSDLACNAKKERALLRYSVPSVDQDDEIAASVWKQTMGETTTGALLGPFEHCLISMSQLH